jgi:hypothetical protein
MANVANVKVLAGNQVQVSGAAVQLTGSGASLTVSSSQVVVTGSVLTNGNVTVGGTLTAANLVVNTVTTASTVFTSGSTRFGDEPDDSHIFTGSVNINGVVSSSVGFSGSATGLTGVIKSVTAGTNLTASTVNGAVTVALTSSITGGLNTLSGVQTGSFTVLSASTAEFSGNVLIYGTASLSSNPDAAYVRYVASSGSIVDKIVIFPGIYTDGQVTASLFSGSGAGLTNLPAANLTGIVPLVNGGTGQSLSGNLTGKLLIGSGSSLVTGSLLAGTNVSIVTGSGSITINVTGSLGISQVTSSDPNLEIQNGTGPVVTASLNTTLTGLVSVTTDELTVNTTAVLTGQVRLSITAVTASYLVQDTDNVLMVTNTGTITITLPSEPDDGRLLIVKKKTNSIETVTLDGIEVDGESTFDLNGPYQSVTLVAYDDRWFIT